MGQSATTRTTIGIITLFAAGALAFGASGCLRSDWDTRYESGGDLHAAQLSVENDAGDVDVITADVERLSFEAEIYGDGITIEHEVRGDTLYLGSSIPWWCDSCYVSFTIVVPADTTVDVETGAGSIALEGLDAEALLDTGAGDIRVAGFTGERLDMTLGTGTVRAEGLEAEAVTASTGGGSIHLTFDETPRAVDAACDAGSLYVAVPAGAYDIDWQIGAGSFDYDGIAIDRDAPNTMSLATGAGSITVQGN